MSEARDILIAENPDESGDGVTKYNLRISPRLFPAIETLISCGQPPDSIHVDEYGWTVIGYRVVSGGGVAGVSLARADGGCSTGGGGG